MLRDRLVHRYGEIVQFVRLFLRGLKDAYDQFVQVMIVSVLWWICAVLIVPGPPATVALFRYMDPRNQVAQPEARDFLRTMRDSFKTAWGIAAFTLPVVLVLLWNTLYFRGTDSTFSLMVPLWIVMILITMILMLYAYATAAAMESRTRNAFKGATYLLVMRPFSSALMILFLLLLSLFFTVLVVPLILFGPGVSAAVINRFVLSGFGVEVIDPSSPTQERSHEVSRGINLDEGIRGRFRRARGGSRS